MDKKKADNSGNRLKKICYSDKEIRLECYADTFVYKLEQGNKEKRILIAIRFGGYPEQVKAMESAIYGGGTIETESAHTQLKFDCMTKRYTRQIVTGEIYSESTMFATDEDDVPIERSSKDKGQTKLDTPPRHSYIFCKENDTDRLFAEIDKRVSVPLIPAFKEYLLEELQSRNILTKLEVKSVSEQFEAWELCRSSGDKNIISVVEDGLKNRKISIPMATKENTEVFKDVNTVSQYLKAFGTIIAERIKSQFVPLFDPATMPLSNEVLSVNDNILSNTGYSLFELNR